MLPTPNQMLIDRFREKAAVIGIVGMGYVGQPLALRYSKQGFRVLGFDIDSAKMEQLNNGRTAIEHIGDAAVAEANQRGFSVTDDFRRIAEVDAIIICVPTPLGKFREPDLSFVVSTCDSICRFIRKGQVISLESTTYPGTTEEEIVPRVLKTGLVPGEDTFIVYSPEREDPGNSTFNTKTIPKIVGGHTLVCLEVGKALYEAAVDRVVPVSSTKTAEMTKLLENIYRSVNIGLVNEMKIVADRMGIDIFEVIDAAATKPFGYTPFYPGPGLGGHCIPIDPFYLTWKAKEFGLHTRFIELSGEVNRAMPGYVMNKLVFALNERGKSVKGSRILVLGIAYKKNVDDMRESPSVAIMELIRDAGGVLSYSDPHVPIFPKMREHKFELQSVALTSSVLAEADAVIVATDHAKFDFEHIESASKLIIDCRGVFRYPKAHIIKS